MLCIVFLRNENCRLHVGPYGISCTIHKPKKVADIKIAEALGLIYYFDSVAELIEKLSFELET